MTTAAPLRSRPPSRPSAEIVARRPPSRLRALLSALVLVAMVVVVPIVLHRVGGSPFGGWDLGRVRHGLAQKSFEPQPVVHLLGRVAVAMAWLAWLWLCLCVALELRGRILGAPPVALPGGRTFQTAAAVLVGTVLAASMATRHPPPSAAPAHPPAVTTSTALHGTGTPTLGPSPSRLAVLDDDLGAEVWLEAGTGTGNGTETEPETRTTVEAPEADVPPRGVRPGNHGAVAEWAWDAGEDDRGGAGGGALPHRTAPGPSLRVEAPAPRRHVVGPRETLWSIARDRLGAAQRWRELADLNYGRPQPDGGTLGGDHWIRPGWQLVLDPETGVTREVAGSDQQPLPATAPVIGDPVAETGPGGALPEPIGQRHTPPVMPLGAGVLGTGVTTLLDRMRRVQQRHRRPGGLIVLPRSEGRAMEARVRVEAGLEVVPEVEVAMRLVLEGGCPSGRDAIRRVVAVRVGADTVDVVVEPDTGATPPPDPFLRSAGGRVLRASRRELRAAGSTLLTATDGLSTGPGRAPTTPLLVTVGRTEDGPVLVDLEAVGSAQLAGPPVTVRDALRALALELATSVWSPAFDLVVLGCDPRLGRLPRVRSVPVDDEGLASFLDELWSRRVDGERRLRAMGVVSFAQARAWASSGPAEGDTAVPSPTAPPNSTGRYGAPERRRPAWDEGRAWRPVVVLCGPAADPSTTDELLAVADGAGRHGIIVVTTAPTPDHPDRPGDPGGPGGLGVGHRLDGHPSGDTSAAASRYVVPLGGGSTIELSPATDTIVPAVLEVLGSVVAPQLLDGQDLEELEEVLAVAADRGTVDWAVEPYRTLTVAAPETASPADPEAEPPPPWDSRHSPTAVSGRVTRTGLGTGPGPRTGSGMEPEVEVRILGPVDVVGGVRSFTRAGAMELVLYLAVHPEGATTDQWATALWPDRLMAPSSLHSTISVARRALGVSDVSGEDHLPRAHGRLQLAGTVGTDWQRFVSQAEQGRPDDPEPWRQALELVRGRPFEGLRDGDWAILEGIAPAMEAAVVDVSGQLAGSCLRAGDPGGAEWAARRGLLVSPYDERLYRVLLRAADLAGNPAGVEAVMVELVQLVADGIEPLESVHPSTLQLYRSLSRRSRLALPRRTV